MQIVRFLMILMVPEDGGEVQRRVAPQRKCNPSKLAKCRKTKTLRSEPQSYSGPKDADAFQIQKVMRADCSS